MTPSEGYEEIEATKDDVIEDLNNPLVNTLEGVSGGQKAALLTPVSVAARIANQDSSEWSEPPAIIKDSVPGEIAFELSRLLTTGVVAAPIAGAAGITSAAGLRAAESAAETLNQRSADDLVFGRQQAVLMGRAAEQLGIVEDGKELTERLIKGEDVDAQVFVGIAGFLQNYTFNTAGEVLLSKLAKGLGKASDTYKLNKSRSAKVNLEKAEAEGRVLYHGTSKRNSRSLKQSGYKRGAEGSNLLGRGVYFTNSPGYASGYGQEVVAGIVPDNLNIIDTTDKPFTEFLEKIGVGSPADPDEFEGVRFLTSDQKKALRKWSEENGVDGITFYPAFNETGSLPETVIFDPKKADQIAAPKADVAINSVGEVAEKLGKSVEDVQSSLDDVETPAYSKDFEPHESQTINDQVPVSKVSTGKTYINDEALAIQALNRKGIASDGLDAADRHYFTNYRVFSENASYRKALEEATETLTRLDLTSNDRDRVLFGAQRWIRQFMDEVDGSIDVERALVEFPFEMVKPLNDEALVKKALISGGVETNLREGSQVTEEGFVAATLLGEEMGVRLSQAARQATNLDTAGVDFGAAVENFLELQDRAELFLIPLRRAKRRWSIEGFVQQRKNVKRVKDADIKLQNPEEQVSFDAPSREFSTDFSVDGDSPSTTARALWERYQAGDADAGQTLKTYLATIAYADPKTATAQLSNLTDTLKNQLKKGNSDATRQLYYSYMLTRLSPQVSSLSSNIVSLIRNPIGTILSGERAFGFGQFVGGMSVWSDSLQNAAQAFKTGVGLNTGSKIDVQASDFKLKDLQLDELWKGRRSELIEQGKKWNSPEMAQAWVSYTRQKIANKPIMSVAARALLAQDEFAKTAYGAQVATGRAWKEAAERNLKRNSPEFKQLLQDHMKEVFRDGIATGKIIDEEVLEGAKSLTFQTSIPSEGNLVDKAFYALQQGAENSAFWNWVSPFTRVTYNTMEQGGQMLAGSLGPAGKWLLTRIPRYKSIMAGEMGDVAQMQLKSNLAFAQHWMFAAGALGTMGFATGNNPPPGMPKRSFIIPMPGSKTGFIGVPYGRIEPVATPTSIIVDLVQGLRDEVITQGDYNRFMEEMMLSLGMATLDKSFTTSLTNSAALFDVKNFSEGTINQAVSAGSAISAAVLPVGAYGGLTRMVADWVNPYKTVNRVQDNAQEQFWLSFRQRILGGAGNPVQYDVLSPTGDPQPLMKVAQVGNKDNNYFQSTFATFLDELLVPGRTADAPANDTVRQSMDSVGFTKDLITKNLRTYSGIALSAEEQSMLSKDISQVGRLRDRLETYFKSAEFARKSAAIAKFRSDNQMGSTSDGSRSAEYRQQIHTDINSIFATAKELAATKGELSKSVDFQIKYLASKRKVPVSQVRQEMSGRMNDLLIPTR